jgi:hypothetical protein
MGNQKSGRLKRFLFKFFIIIAIIAVLLILIISPLTKYLIQRYDVRYTGREIELSRAYINPFTGQVTLRGLKMYEQNSDTVFLNVQKLSVNVSMLKLFSKVYQVTSLTIDEPQIRVIQNDTVFNFSDLIKRFAVTKDTIPVEKLKFNLLNLKLSNGSVRYVQEQLPLEYSISDINLNSPGMRWSNDTVKGNFSLNPPDGHVTGDFIVNIDTLDYDVNVNVEVFKTGSFGKLLNQFADAAAISGDIKLKLNVTGNVHYPLDIAAKGRFELNDFHFGRNTEKDYFSVNRFLIVFNDIDLKKGKYFFDSIYIDKPYLLYEKYDSLDNYRLMFTKMLAKKAAQKADTASTFLKINGTDYFINKLILNEGNITFRDFSLSESFSFITNPFNIKADSIDKLNRRVKITFNGKIQPYGNFAAALVMDVKNEKNFDFNFQFRKIPASMFNPYIMTYTSYQLDRGTIEMTGDWTVRNADINSINHFLVIDPRDTKRVRGRDTKWIPLPLIMSFVRERGGMIDYVIPVKGNLKDPKFKLSDVITDLLRNILVKPPTTPYGLRVRNVEEEIEKTLTVKWRMRQIRIEDDQKKFLKGIADFLKKNPEAIITVQPVIHEQKEKENILLFEARKKFYMIHNNKSSITESDSMKIEKTDLRDSVFLAAIDSSSQNPILLTIQEKCYRYLGKDVVDRKYNLLLEGREQAFMKIFRDEKVANRIEMLKVKNEIPYNWFSYYELKYKGDVPKELSKAYNKLYEINTAPPREKYPQFKRRK